MKGYKTIIYSLLLICMFFRFYSYGFQYFSNMDDNNQYGIYNLRNENIRENVIEHYKLHGVRPLAFYTDAYVFSWLWNRMYILLFIMIIMHFVTGIMFKQITSKLNISFGFLGLVIFTLSPFLVQATYWISASSRLVLSLFFSILSIRLFIYYIENRDKASRLQKALLILFILALNILCTGYYEQTIVFNFVFFIYVIYKYKGKWFYSVPCISTFLIVCHYFVSFANNTMQERGSIILDNVLEHSLDVVKAILNTFLTYHKHSIPEAISNEITNFTIAIISIWLASMLGVFIFHTVKKQRNSSILKSFAIGIILFIIPFAPFFVLEKAVVDIRNFYISYLGISTVIASIYYGICEKFKYFNVINAYIIFTLVFICLLCNCYEIKNYKNVYEFDNYIASKIVQNLDNEMFENRETICIDYDMEILNFKNNSGMCRTILEEDWAVMGKVQLVRKSTKIGQIMLRKRQKPYIYIDKNLEIETEF